MASTVRGGPTRTSCSDCPARLASNLCQACDHVATMRSPHCRGRCGGRPVGPLAPSDDEMGRNTRPAGGAWEAGARAGVRPVCGVLVSSSDKLYPCYGIERPSAGAMLPCRRPAVESGRRVGCDALAYRSRHARASRNPSRPFPHPVYPVHPLQMPTPWHHPHWGRYGRFVPSTCFASRVRARHAVPLQAGSGVFHPFNLPQSAGITPPASGSCGQPGRDLSCG